MPTNSSNYFMNRYLSYLNSKYYNIIIRLLCRTTMFSRERRQFSLLYDNYKKLNALYINMTILFII